MRWKPLWQTGLVKLAESGDETGKRGAQVVDQAQHGTGPQGPREDYVPYDRRRLSYSGTFKNPAKVLTIRVLEWMTGKLELLRRIRHFEQIGPKAGVEFFTQSLQVMGIDLAVSQEQVDRIPATGPLIVVANHPHGLVDGLVMAELVGRKRDDFMILTRSLLTGIPEISQHMLPVPFPHEDNALAESLEMRKTAMQKLKEGGVIILFPAGAVASAHSMFGPAVEKEWNPFTAKMIARSGASVLPIYFPGQNSRLYLMADRVSATLRQGLLLHEVRHALDRPQTPVVGEVLPPEELEKWHSNPRGFMAWLREHTLALGRL